MKKKILYVQKLLFDYDGEKVKVTHPLERMSECRKMCSHSLGVIADRKK